MCEIYFVIKPVIENNIFPQKITLQQDTSFSTLLSHTHTHIYIHTAFQLLLQIYVFQQDIINIINFAENSWKNQ